MKDLDWDEGIGIKAPKPPKLVRFRHDVPLGQDVDILDRFVQIDPQIKGSSTLLENGYVRLDWRFTVRGILAIMRLQDWVRVVFQTERSEDYLSFDDPA